jgi:hypothetical protein
LKIYPKPNSDEGFTRDEIIRGEIFLYADVKCTECGKEQSLAMAGSIDNGKCIRCGGRTT